MKEITFSFTNDGPEKDERQFTIISIAKQVLSDHLLVATVSATIRAKGDRNV